MRQDNIHSKPLKKKYEVTLISVTRPELLPASFSQLLAN